jgi:hypothetical protein
MSLLSKMQNVERKRKAHNRVYTVIMPEGESALEIRKPPPHVMCRGDISMHGVGLLYHFPWVRKQSGSALQTKL